MLYFLKQTFNMHESHIHSFFYSFHLYLLYRCKLLICTYVSCKRFIMLPPLTLTSFKAIAVTLKYARFLKIRNMALYQERMIVSKFQYTQCIGSRPIKLKPISRVSHLSSIPFSFPIRLSSEISQPDYIHVNTCNNVQIMHPNATSMKIGILSYPFQCKPEMPFF